MVSIPVLLLLVGSLPLLSLATLGRWELLHVSMNVWPYLRLDVTVLRLTGGDLSRSLALNGRCFAFHINLYNPPIRMTNMRTNLNALRLCGDLTSIEAPQLE
jgi:hypothetical protein